MGRTAQGVVTETTAELAASLSLAAARRIVEADEFMRVGLFDGWLPHLFVGNLLKGQTVGVIGAGRSRGRDTLLSCVSSSIRGCSRAAKANE